MCSGAAEYTAAMAALVEDDWWGGQGLASVELSHTMWFCLGRKGGRGRVRNVGKVLVCW